jgi:hypothetical protein
LCVEHIMDVKEEKECVIAGTLLKHMPLKVRWSTLSSFSFFLFCFTYHRFIFVSLLSFFSSKHLFFAHSQLFSMSIEKLLESASLLRINFMERAITFSLKMNLRVSL